MKTFKNLSDLLTKLHNEAACKQYLETVRWGGNVVCPHCGHNRVYKTNVGYKCASNVCYKKFSVISGTVFEASKLPLQKWFIAIYLQTSHKKGISSCQLARDLGVTQKTAWFMLHRIREMMRQHSIVMQGVVESDTTYVGGKVSNMSTKKREQAKNKFSSFSKTTVLGFLERGGQVKSIVVPVENRPTVGKLVRGIVKPNSLIITDMAAAFKPLKNEYFHEIVNHAQGEFVREGLHTNTIEGFWSLLKRGIIGIYHQVSPKHLQRYCDEFGYRYNTRKTSETERFNHSITQSKGRRLKYRELIAN